MSTSPHVIDVGVEGFETTVLAKSQETPVLVDFWAPWCGPCKTLGPLLEKLADEFNGGFILAKVDVDKEQQLAGYFQIRSVPTVMLVKGGQIVDGFPRHHGDGCGKRRGCARIRRTGVVARGTGRGRSLVGAVLAGEAGTAP